jgi:DNA-binding protein
MPHGTNAATGGNASRQRHQCRQNERDVQVGANGLSSWLHQFTNQLAVQAVKTMKNRALSNVTIKPIKIDEYFLVRRSTKEISVAIKLRAAQAIFVHLPSSGKSSKLVKIPISALPKSNNKTPIKRAMGIVLMLQICKMVKNIAPM